MMCYLHCPQSIIIVDGSCEDLVVNLLAPPSLQQYTPQTQQDFLHEFDTKILKIGIGRLLYSRNRYTTLQTFQGSIQVAL